MPNTDEFVKIAAAIGDQARSKMLLALLGGKALTASELALEADITAQTATTHLQKLVANNLVSLEKQGRHKYFRLYNLSVAQLLESMLSLSQQSVQLNVQTGPPDKAMRHARVCYDHLAGEQAVRLMAHFISTGLIEYQQNNPTLTQTGVEYFTRLGAPVAELMEQKRPLCKSCLDWSERKHHLSGSLGKWILEDLFSKKWAKKDMDSRAIRFTPSGEHKFTSYYHMK